MIRHGSGNFVETVRWWIKGHTKQMTEDLDRYFRAVIEPVIGKAHGLISE